MRVISGSARGRRLKRVPGDATRPIMDRAKENLFNILRGAVRETRWLDLFAGTGQVGIEALSRGAEHVVFVDSSRRAIPVIHQNLAITNLAELATVVKGDAFDYLRQHQGKPFDYIFVAPPQYQGLWSKSLTLIDEDCERLLRDRGRVVVQIDPREHQACVLRNLSLEDSRTYGNTELDFYRCER